MNKVYIARNYRSKFDAAGKAKMDCETILQNNGWKNIGLKQTWIANSILGTLISVFSVTLGILRLKKGSTLCLQYPFHKFYGYCLWGAKLKKCDVLTIVHDVRSLKGKYGFSEKEIAILNQSDKLIVHNDKMRAWFEQQNIKPQLANIEAFDYLHTDQPQAVRTPINVEQIRVVFAGNMGPFIYELDHLERGNFKFDLYGVGFDASKIHDRENTRLDYKGCFPADKVIDCIDGDFGLVWYGNSLDSCDGETGQYLQYNNPHKLSLYLLCEMPIIIWDKAAMADFVETAGIGFKVSSLKEIKQRLSELTPEQIAQMKANVLKVKADLQTGQYLSRALKALNC
ncbi:hypothetical protein [Pseudoalteromonas ulvae]|uniref:Beta-1,6-galactofuranosyltransferase n=1 Tax=Pseudoalteromonas ulvae TaxID=107327 RepID=A0A244CRV1_PSEDV|nr:hypothetical protein [Pseudoalteromonas ulvae]OUL58347.1 hypothetical protein B1199_08420 [Pseudoalteromonas ulvae]